MANGYKALTITYNGLSSVLQSDVQIAKGFDPRIQTLPSPPQITSKAIWDTGATASVISQNVVSLCGLKPIGVVNVHTAGGTRYCNAYLVSMLLPNGVGFPSVRVTEGIIQGADVLVGMDIIANGDFAVSNFKGKTVFTYRYPSTARTDYVDEAKLSSTPKVGRNAQCPCGSGKKYKKCCGAT